MKDSRDMQRPQKTLYEGSPTEVGLEVQDRKEACSITSASSIAKARVQVVELNLMNRRIPNGTYGGVRGR
ncbi:hypothetical protein Y919_03785 [Caloranaerobacter azorensis H53214]|uniref:Uncharacterized protein n=1 Tax=Caloranaerobacter azorensis H53214 TaxID=1156417 RepID=A0A096DNN6_9FIRM|nr:hypothetical protein Y919_03785 [Caloranaerobacter azorensis H53214]